MKRLLLITSLLFLGLIVIASVPDDSDAFYKEVEEWHQRRINALTSETGWLTLAGLFWLEQGDNTFGSASDNDLIFPEDMPKYMGSFNLQDSIVTLTVNENISILNDSLSVTKMKLINDHHEDRTDLSYGSYSWYILKRQDKYGIRLKNSAHQRLKNFTGIDRFPVDIKWRVKAHLEKYDPPKNIKVANVLGQVSEMSSPGKLHFKFDGKEYTIDPFSSSPGRYWIIFGDKTNEIETYGAGRYLYIDAVDENGETYIDFNQSYNPPCAFTPYSTCTLPPRQNILDLRVTAGEKSWHGDH